MLNSVRSLWVLGCATNGGEPLKLRDDPGVACRLHRLTAATPRRLPQCAGEGKAGRRSKEGSQRKLTLIFF